MLLELALAALAGSSVTLRTTTALIRLRIALRATPAFAALRIALRPATAFKTLFVALYAAPAFASLRITRALRSTITTRARWRGTAAGGGIGATALAAARTRGKAFIVATPGLLATGRLVEATAGTGRRATTVVTRCLALGPGAASATRGIAIAALGRGGIATPATPATGSGGIGARTATAATPGFVAKAAATFVATSRRAARLRPATAGATRTGGWSAKTGGGFRGGFTGRCHEENSNDKRRCATAVANLLNRIRRL